MHKLIFPFSFLYQSSSLHHCRWRNNIWRWAKARRRCICKHGLTAEAFILMFAKWITRMEVWEMCCKCHRRKNDVSTMTKYVVLYITSSIKCLFFWLRLNLSEYLNVGFVKYLYLGCNNSYFWGKMNQIWRLVTRQMWDRTFKWHLKEQIPHFLEQQGHHDGGFCSPQSVCPCSPFLCRHRSRAHPEKEQHNRVASCHFKRGDPSNLLSIHSGPGFIHFLQSRLSKPSWFWKYVSACEGGSVGLARGSIAGGCGGLWFVCAVL